MFRGVNSTGVNAAKVALIGRAPCHTDVITISLRPDVKLDGVLMRLSVDVVIYVMFYFMCIIITYERSNPKLKV